jgi:hypothetical protein
MPPRRRFVAVVEEPFTYLVRSNGDVSVLTIITEGTKGNLYRSVWVDIDKAAAQSMMRAFGKVS